MAVYSIADVKELLLKNPPGHKIQCFVRGTNSSQVGLISSKQAFTSVMDKAKKLVWSVLLRTDICSNRPREIIDTLDISDKLLVKGQKVAKAL